MPSMLAKGFYASTLSTFHWLYIVILGIIAKKLGFVDDKFQKSLSKIVTNIILPCFIFSQIVNNFRIKQYKILFQITTGCFLIYGFGLIVAYFLGIALKLTKKQRNFLMANFSTPHNTSIYVILIGVVGPFLDEMIPPNPDLVGDSVKRGLLYVVINSILQNIWKWSVAYALIEPDDEEDIEIYENYKPLLNQESENIQIAPKKKYKEKTFGDIMRSIVNMPLVTSIFSLILTFSPHIQSYFITPKALLKETLINVNLTISKSYSFIVIFILGLSFADSVKIDNENKSQVSRATFLNKSNLFWICLVKLVIMPIISVPLVLYIFRQFLSSDDVLVFNYLFLSAAPPAINLIVICAYKDTFVHEISQVMIATYTAAIFTLTFSIAIFMYILGTLNQSLMHVVPITNVPV